jgi:hypothetical protein
MELSDWLWAKTRQTHAIALARLFELLVRFAEEHRREGIAEFVRRIWRDYQRLGRSDRPAFFERYASLEPPRERTIGRQGPDRQSRHRVL